MPTRRMILFLYSLALYGVLVVGAPWWLFRMATTSKYRHGLLERLGRVPHRLLDVPQSKAAVIWVQAVSVGEVLAASRLISELETAGRKIFVSTTTRTGQTLARNRFGEKCVFYFPLDFRWAVRRYLRALQPALVVLVETELWPNLLAECASMEIPVALVNARISDRSYPRYKRLRALWRILLSSLALVLAQSEEDARRLRSIGAPQDRVFWAGNLKYDIHAPQETAFNITLRSQLPPQTRLVVAGSTLEGEERMLINAWAELLATNADLVMVLAPRHPERFDAVAQLLDRSRMKWYRRSLWIDSPQPLEPGTILLLDSIGELASAYALAAVAFVGGSLVAAGGHNPLEPAQFAVPVVIGPHYLNFRAIVDELRSHSAICVVEEQTLAATLIDLLDKSKSGSIGQRGKEIFERHAGATGRTISAINGLLERRRGEGVDEAATGTRPA